MHRYEEAFEATPAAKQLRNARDVVGVPRFLEATESKTSEKKTYNGDRWPLSVLIRHGVGYFKSD